MRPPMRNTGLRLSSVYSILMPPSLSDHPHGGRHRVAALVYLRHLLHPPRIGITTTQMLDSPQHRRDDPNSHSLPSSPPQRRLILTQKNG
jgi:hypothetical protein